MSDQVYHFEFKPGLDLREVRRSLELAMLAAEILHGSAAVRLDGKRHFDGRARRCLIDGSAAPGRDIARLFTGFIEREFGPRSFRVLRLDGNFHDAVAEYDADEIRKMMRGGK